MKLLVYADKAGKYRWSIRARNGNIIASSSQGYVTVRDCRKNLGRLAVYLSAVPIDAAGLAILPTEVTE